MQLSALVFDRHNFFMSCYLRSLLGGPIGRLISFVMRARLAACAAFVIGGLLAREVVRAETPTAITAGSIVGHVRLSHVRGTPLPSNVYVPRGVAGTPPAPPPEIKNVVVYLKNVTYNRPLPITHREILQQGETFVPRVVAITRGSTVSFPNDDPIFHNVFSLSSAATFNLGRYPRGESRTREFTKPGLVKVFCQIHSQMSASILVLDHPYFAVPELDGAFTLSEVPAGQYTIVGWHERVGERVQTIQVRSGEASSVQISLPVDDRR